MQQSTENRTVFSFLKITGIIITLSIIIASLQLSASAQIYGRQTKTAAAVAGIDTTFAPRLEQYGYVTRAIPQPDGKTVVIGRFDKINNIERKDIVRLNADNTLDTSFALPPQYYSSLHLLPNGKFIAISTDSAIVRLNADGSLDYSFNFARTIRVVNIPKFKARSDGKVFVYGQFTVKKRNLEIARNLIVLDEIGGIESGYTIGNSGRIDEVDFLPNGKTAVTGYFEVKRNGATVGRNFAVLDEHGLIDPNFDTFFGDEGNQFPIKKATAQPDGKLLVYGNFKGAYKQNGLRRILSKNNGILRLNADGTFDHDFSVPFASAHIRQTIVQPDGRILLFGGIQSSGGANFKFLTRLYPDGSLDNSFNDNMPLSSAYNWSSASEMQLLPDNKILVSGHFRVNNQPNVEKLVRLNPDGTHDASFQTGLILGGDPTGFFPQPDGKVFIYGNFGKIGSRTRIGLARLNADGSTDEAFRSDTVRFDDVDVRTLNLQPDGKIIVGGKFSVVNGEYIYSAENALNPSISNSCSVVRLNADGSLDNSFAPLTNVFEEIFSAALQPDGKILVSGFSSYSTFFTYVLRLNPNGTTDASFNRVRFFQNSASPVISDIAVQTDGKILVVGYFQQADETTRQKVARLNADGSLDQTFVYNGYFFHSEIPRKIVLQPDGKILIGGELGNAENAPGLGRFKADGTLDAGFRWNSAYLLTYTYDLQMQPDGKILFAGSMGLGIQATTLPHDLYRMNQNGVVETRFNLKADKFVSQPDGKIVAQVFEGQPSTAQLKRVFPNGGTDDTFNFTLGEGKANKLLLQTDGKILLVGRFRTINGVRQPGLARLNP